MAQQTTNLTSQFWQRVASPSQLLKLVSQSSNCSSVICLSSATDPGVGATSGELILLVASLPLFGPMVWWARCVSGDGNVATALAWTTDIAIDLPVPATLPTSAGESGTWSLNAGVLTAVP